MSEARTIETGTAGSGRRRWFALCSVGLRTCSGFGLRLLQGLLALLVLGYLVFGAAFVTLRYAVLPNIDNYRPVIEREVTKALGVPVAIADVDADWRGLRPRLTLTDLKISRADGQTALSVPSATAVVSWWSLPVLALRLHSLAIDAPELEVHRFADGRYSIAGIAIDPAAAGDSAFADWLFGQRELVIRGARLRFVDEAAGGAVIEFERLGIVMRNSGLHHRFALQARPPATLGSDIDLRADFRHTPLLHRASDWRAWRGELYANLDHADLGRLAAHVKLPFEITRGSGAVRAWLTLDHGRFDRLTADVALAEVEGRAAPELPWLALARMRGRIVARELAGKDARGKTAGHEVALSGFSLRMRDGFELAPSDLRERIVTREDGSVVAGLLAAGTLDLDALARLSAHLPLAERHRELIARFEPRGRLEGLSYDWTGPIAAPEHYRVSARFSDLALQPQPAAGLPDQSKPQELHIGTPGFGGLAGRVEATENGGRIQFDAAGARLAFPGVFAEPVIALDRLAAQVEWERTAAGMALRVTNASFRNADAAGSLSGSYASGGKGPGIVKLDGRLTRADARAVHRYLPLTIPAATRDWVRRAVLAGGASDVDFRLRGDLADFPYIRPADGEFRIAARIKGARLDFAPDETKGGQPAWPPLDELAGELVFERNGFSVVKASARTLDATLTRVNARLADFSDPDLKLDVGGQVNGSLRAMLDYVAASPVGGWLDGALAEARASGDARLTLNLALPLARMAASRVSGELVLTNNDIHLGPAIPALTRASGRIEFTEAGMSAHGITATALGGPVRIDGGPGPGQILALRAEGTATAGAVRRFLDAASLERTSGAARYRADLVARAGGMELGIDSDLVGLAIDLPAPLAKAAPAAWPLRVRIKPAAAGQPARAGEPNRDLVEVTLGANMSAALALEHRGAATRVLRGMLAINQPAELPAEGLLAVLDLDRFDLDAWRAWADAQTAPATTPGAAGARARLLGWDLPDQTVIALQAGELSFMGKRFERVVAGLNRRDGVWSANIEAAQAAGTITWAEDTGGGRDAPVVARLRRLSLESSQSSDVAQLLDTAGTEDVPALDVEVEAFEVAGKKLGKLALVANNVGTGAGQAWQLEKLAITSPDATLTATGAWRRAAAGHAGAPAQGRRMGLEFTLDVANLGHFLDRMGVRETMREGTARLEGEVSWLGGPLAIDYPSLDGKLVLSADRGQFLKSDPGAARLLGVLSLQSLARRMALDFRDVFAQGFAFDTVRADIELAGGVASTRDFRMRGVAATVLIDGSADLAHETQDLHLVVLPDINAGGASVVYGLLANPVVGLGTFLAQLFLREPLMKAMSHEYHVTGTWSDPQLEQIERKNGTTTKSPAG